jgi:cell pole-organizing protein PopZ
MGQTGSAQREPSMEEILASIRRIIEDSDTVRTPAEQGGEDAEAAVREPAEVDAFRQGLSDAPAATEKPFSMAEIQASVPPVERDMADRPDDLALSSDHPDPVETPALRFSEPAEVSSITQPADVPADEEFDIGRIGGDADPTPASEAGHEERWHDAPVTAAEQAEPKPSIISEVTGRQVAAAFGELSDAFASTRRRSFDEMAEEMLRPMLQDWLDNNLPLLVERLVREEIERVARGG